MNGEMLILKTLQCTLGFGVSSRQHSVQYPLANVVIQSQTSSTLCGRRKQMRIVILKAQANGI